MGKAIPYDYRVKIISRLTSEFSYTEVAEEFGYSVSAIKKLWYKYKKVGDSAFHTQYHNCGSTSPYGASIRAEIKAIRDNEQGSHYVHSKLIAKYPTTPLPSPRTLNRWWAESGENRSKGRPSTEEKKVGVKKSTTLGK